MLIFRPQNEMCSKLFSAPLTYDFKSAAQSPRMTSPTEATEEKDNCLVLTLDKWLRYAFNISKQALASMFFHIPQSDLLCHMADKSQTLLRTSPAQWLGCPCLSYPSVYNRAILVTRVIFLSSWPLGLLDFVQVLFCI